MARRFLRSEEDSADAVQDAFLAAFRALDDFAGHSTLGTWLHRILVNTCLMKLRVRSRCQEVLIEELLPACDETGHQPRRPSAMRPLESGSVAVPRIGGCGFWYGLTTLPRPISGHSVLAVEMFQYFPVML